MSIYSRLFLQQKTQLTVAKLLSSDRTGINLSAK